LEFVYCAALDLSD